MLIAAVVTAVVVSGGLSSKRRTIYSASLCLYPVLQAEAEKNSTVAGKMKTTLVLTGPDSSVKKADIPVHFIRLWVNALRQACDCEVALLSA